MAKTKVDVRRISGAELAATIAKIYATPPAVVEKTKRILGLM